MSKLKFLFKDEEEEKEKFGIAQRMRGIGELPKYEIPESTKLKFTADIGLGVGAKAEMGVTLPETPSIGVSQRMRGIGEAPKKYSLEGITTELSEANKRRNSLWWNELKTTEDKLKFIKQENWSPELKQAELEVQKLSEEASKLGVNMNDWIQYGVYATFFTAMAVSILPIVSQLPKSILNNLTYKVEGKIVKGQELKNVLRRVAYPEIVKPSIFDRKVFDEFTKRGGIKGIGGSLEKGVTITEAVPRFAFGTKLYAGLPADEIVKAIVETGKVTAEAVKGLDPIKVSQVTQALLNTSPALASEFLKAVEKPEVIPKVEVKEPVIPEGIKKSGNVYNVKDKDTLKQLDSVENGALVSIGNYYINVKFSDKGKHYDTASLLSTIEDKDTGKLIETIHFPVFIDKFLHNVKEVKLGAPSLEKIEAEPAKVTPPAEPKEELKAEVKEPEIKLTEKQIIPTTIDEAKEILKVDVKKPSIPKEKLAEIMVEKKISLADIEAVKGEKINVKEPKDIIIALRDIKAVKKEAVVEPAPKAIPKELEPLAEEKLPSIIGVKIEHPIHYYIKSDVINKFTDRETFKKNVERARETFVADKELDDLSDYNIEKEFGSLENYYNWVKDHKTEINSVKNQYNSFIDKIPIDDKTKSIWKKDPENFELNYEDYLSKMKATQAKPAEKVAEIAPAPEVKPEVELATPAQINKSYSIAKSKAMVSEEGKLKPQYRQIAEAMTGKRYIEKMTPEEAEMFIDSLNRLPEPKYRNGKLVAPSIPRTMKLTTEGFFQKKYGEPTPIWLLTDQTYYATKLGIKPLVAPFEKGKQEFDLEFRKSSNLVDRMVNKLNTIAKTPGWERVKSKVKNIPTKAESKMAGLLNKHEATPPGLSQNEEDVFKYFRNLSKDIWRRENEVREKLDLPPIKYKTAYFRHTADAMAKEMLEGKYPFPQGIKYWSEKMVGKKIFNPMEFHRKLSDDLIDLWSKDIRAVTKAMLWNGLKEIHLAEPAKFLNEQLNAISKDLPEYKNLTPREQAAYDQTRVMPASTKKWLINYINQVIKGQETEVDASLNRIVTKSGLKGIFDKVLSPFGRSVGRTPITNLFVLSGRAVISGVMGWVPRQLTRNFFQFVQDLALYGVEATLKSFLPASVDKNLKGLLSESLFLKSYTGYEELPTDLMGKLEKVWLGPYGIVAVFNAAKGMKAAYWNILGLIKNPKYKKYGWADPQRTKDTPKGFLYPSEKEKLLKEMEFGASCTQYQYIPMGMPGIFRYKALIPLTRLQSWWMNYFAKFNREAIHRALKGKPSWSGEDGPTLPWSRRVNWLKYLVIGGAILTAMGYRRSFLIGVLPTYMSPAGQVALGFYNYATATEDWQKKRALNQIYYSWKAFIPGSLAWRDFIAVWNGEKDLEEILFYGKKEEKKVQPPLKITIPKSGKLKFTEPKLDIKSTKLKFNF